MKNLLSHDLLTDHTTSRVPDKSLQKIQYEAMKLIFIAKCLPGGHSNRKIDEFDKYLA